MANRAAIRNWLEHKLAPHEDPTHGFAPDVLDILSTAIAQDFGGLQAVASCPRRTRRWLVRKLAPHEDPTHSFIPDILDALATAISSDFGSLQAAAGEANPGAWAARWAEAQRARGRGWALPPKTRKDVLVNAIINDSFCLAYVDSALWSRNERDEHERPLNATYGIDGFTIEGLERILADCEAFQELPGVDDAIGGDYALAGSHFWMHRVGSGVGFNDGDWSPEAEEVLSDATSQFDALSVYVGDNGKLYFGEA
jgi:hypothetical protein